MGVFRKGTVWFRYLIDWICYTRILYIDCNQYTLRIKKDM